MLQGGVAHSAADVAECQAIRFRVYCRERSFLQEADYPGETECDDFDQYSTHIAVVEGGGRLLGTARIVNFSPLGFPLQRYCSAMLPSSIAAGTGEVSRLAVPRSVGKQYSGAHWAGFRSREVATRLYQTIWRIAHQQGLSHLMAAMEPSLVRVFKAFDIPWKAIGPAVDYAGLVRPYLMSLEAFDAIKTEAALRFRMTPPVALHQAAA